MGQWLSGGGALLATPREPPKLLCDLCGLSVRSPFRFRAALPSAGHTFSRLAIVGLKVSASRTVPGFRRKANQAGRYRVGRESHVGNGKSPVAY
jgi:hypothetical protein